MQALRINTIRILRLPDAWRQRATGSLRALAMLLLALMLAASEPVLCILHCHLVMPLHTHQHHAHHAHQQPGVCAMLQHADDGPEQPNLALAPLLDNLAVLLLLAVLLVALRPFWRVYLWQPRLFLLPTPPLFRPPIADSR